MHKIKTLLEETAHRPWPLPAGSWAFFQKWDRLLFLHWQVRPDMLRPLLPDRVELDLWKNQAWISIVAFTNLESRPRFLPPFPPLSDFHEVNVRTYVTHGDKPGVYFLSIEAEKRLSALLARSVSGLPYVKSDIRITGSSEDATYEARNPAKQSILKVAVKIGGTVTRKAPLDSWLTERYCLYLQQGRKLQRYQIHHPEWGLANVDMRSFTTNYRFGAIDLDITPDLCHYAAGLNVLVWNVENLDL